MAAARMGLSVLLRVRFGRAMWRFTEAVALDVRSVAVCRIGLGALALMDLAERTALLREFYTDDGFVPRATALSLWRRLSTSSGSPWSLHLLSGALSWEALLVTVHAFSAVALMVGYRPRLAAAVTYVLLLSLCQRNVLVTGGDEWTLAAFLLWLPFLDLDGALGVESWLRRRRGEPEPRRRPTASAGAIGFSSQLFMMLFFAGLQKVVTSPAWRSGDAVGIVMGDLVATDFGHFLQTLPPFATRVMSFGVLVAELVLPWLLVTKVPDSARLVALLGISANLVGFALALRVGRLPWIALAALSARIPGSAWDALGFCATPRKEVPVKRRPDAWATALSVAAGVVLAHAFTNNVAHLGRDDANPAWLDAPSGLYVPRQGWGMFRSVTQGAFSPWVVVSATRRGDTTATLRLPDGAPLDFGPDSSVQILSGSQRWGYFWGRARGLSTQYPDVLARYMEQKCGEFRRDAPLERIEITFVSRHGPEGADLSRQLLASHDCPN